MQEQKHIYIYNKTHVSDENTFCRRTSGITCKIAPNQYACFLSLPLPLHLTSTEKAEGYSEPYNKANVKERFCFYNSAGEPMNIVCGPYLRFYVADKSTPNDLILRLRSSEWHTDPRVCIGFAPYNFTTLIFIFLKNFPSAPVISFIFLLVLIWQKSSANSLIYHPSREMVVLEMKNIYLQTGGHISHSWHDMI